ncbi:DUF2227 family putative metal-binding protein [Cyanobium sp. HWJ4-Hawea]|uniref:DUF2227 family putative metal-binding protein n=1 Tax=Cyanobium sp. HWJ4-Hawea TaxID=2823713 RepID=UPI0020CC6C52|nr:DUF2227 family putative metal-binding protein [Cyanobium sp. HWJ4-Hawea]MCP9809811.1 DUF2227 family putative metal-binding protein [Cyanobium sp. HWJ4-Hawea]
MASGRQHDRATWLLSLPFGLLWGPWLGLAGIGSAGLGFLLGGLLLSPDLDTRSNPTRRWGPLKLLWWPYRSLLSHRSLFSHSPLLGSGLRLAYLLAMLLMICALLHPWGAPSPESVLRGIHQLWLQQRPLAIAALVGVEASSWLHLIQDGDPMPRLPKVGR